MKKRLAEKQKEQDGLLVTLGKVRDALQNSKVLTT